MGYNIIVGGYISTARAAESVPMDVWVPLGDAVVSLCHAILTVFRDFGSRGNRQKCRMLWLVEEMGVEGFRAQVAARMPGGLLARAAPADLLSRDWERRSYFGVQAQKQEGLHWVGLSVPGGRLDADDMDGLAALAERYGSGELRLTVEQNVILPNGARSSRRNQLHADADALPAHCARCAVPTAAVKALLAEPLLQKLTPFPGRIMAGLVACTGSQFCGFSQIETKQTAWRVAEELEAVLDFPRDMRLMWTGCPNSCGQVQVADVGLMGCMVRAPEGQSGMVPGVDVFVGGRVGADSHLATVSHPSVPMGELQPLLERILMEQFGATRKSVPSANPQLSSRFKLAAAAPKRAPPKGTPRKAGNATHICADCGYIYNMPTPLDAQPADFGCPACGALKDRFRPLTEPEAPPARVTGGLDPSVPVALLGPGSPIKLTLMEREVLSFDTRRLRFALPSAQAALGLPVGNHLLLSLPGPDGALVSRPYTPVTGDDARGYVDLVVKVYSNGQFTQLLEHLPLGAVVLAEGPLGGIAYAGRGVFQLRGGGQRRAQRLALVAGGSGITPVLALVRAILSDPADTTSISLLYANKSPADVLLRAELEAIATAHPRSFRVAFTVDAAPDSSAWPHHIGFVTRALMEQTLEAAGPDTQFLFCGPPAMLTHAVQPALDAMAVGKENFLAF
jgi:ferredoxin-nitrite reductase